MSAEPDAPRLGNAPVSWGVYDVDPANPPFSGVLDAIASAGYAATELGPYGYLPTEPGALAAELSRRGLALASSFVALPLEDAAQRTAAVDRCLAVARLLHSRGVAELIVADDEDAERTRIAGRVPGDGSAGWKDADWKEVAATLHAVSQALRDQLAMSVVVHHHAGTFIETPDEIDRLLAETDPERVGLLLDTGHAAYGGADPRAVVARHGVRVRYVHLKDVDGSKLQRVRVEPIPMQEAWRQGVFCPLGEGAVDFPGVVEELRGLGYAGWMIVEQDVVRREDGALVPDPLECARRSRGYLRERVGL